MTDALPELQQPSNAARSHLPLLDDVELYLLAALLMFAPLAFGAVEAWAIFVLQSAVAILVCLWAIRQAREGQLTIKWNPLFLPLLAFAAVTLIQLVPGISAYRHVTFSTFLLYSTYALAGFLITQTLDRTTHVRRLAAALVVYGSAVAMFAVLQNLSSTGKLYWLRTPKFGGWIYGPYVNHNHYAGLMEMLTPIPLVYAFSKYAFGRKRWLTAGAAAFMGATVFLSGSRGGMAAFSIEMALFFWLLFRERTRNRIVLLLGAFLLVALLSIALIGGSEVTARISTISDFKHPDLNTDVRLKIDRDALQMFVKHPLLGWGLGTFADVYPQFRSFYTTSFVNEAHNDYLQVLVETGIVGFGIVVWFLVTAIRLAWRKIQNWPSDINGMVALASLLGITGILVHSFVDFNLEIPSNALLFYSLCTVAAFERRFRNLRRESKSRESTTEAFSETSVPASLEDQSAIVAS